MTKIKGRIFEVMTQEKYLSEDKIKEAISHKTITQYAYILHDKDQYTEEDEKKNPDHKAGVKKEPHWHIIIELKRNATPLSTIAKWFSVPENFIKIWKGKGAFLDAVEYLTHESEKQQLLNKHLYADKEVKANFNFRKALNKHQERKLKYGKNLTDKEIMYLDVLEHGKTLIQCQEENPLLYSEHIDRLKKLRLNYLLNQSPPKTRINYYINGRGGLGKGLCSKALARTLFPTIKNDDELYFIVGSDNATFEGYDGQPVIIWDDMRAVDLLQKLGGRGNVFNIFDTHPVKQRQNIKYGSVNLCNQVNIVNSVQPYIEFLDGLAGEYKTSNGTTYKAEDKGQSYRRIPFIINLHEEDFDLLLNKGFLNDNADFEEYEEYKNIVGNFQKVRVLCKENEELAKEIENKILLIPKQQYDKVKSKEAQEIDKEQVLKELSNCGKTKEQIEFIRKVKAGEEAEARGEEVEYDLFD